jgi:hypothetical protein
LAVVGQFDVTPVGSNLDSPRVGPFGGAKDNWRDQGKKKNKRNFQHEPGKAHLGPS